MLLRKVLLLGLLAVPPVLAAPEDDHARGQLAWQRGDVSGAMKALRAPAAAGHVPSMLLLAYILEGSDFSQEAFTLYRQAAEQNSPEAHAALGQLYAAGRGVAKDENAAASHFSKAAALAADPAQAERWRGRAAEVTRTAAANASAPRR